MKKNNFEYRWPPIHSSIPVWTGKGFLLDNLILPFLSYEIGSSGWTNELTAFHEKTAGDNHFIDKASRKHALKEVLNNLKAPNPVILEIGCSSGHMLRLIRSAMPHAFLIGADYISSPLEILAKQLPDIPLLQFDLNKCPLPDRSLDAVILLNVLEHIEDDFSAMQQIHRILKPNGLVIIEVPAGPHLFDIYDQLLMHFRRYSPSGLKDLVTKTGFKIISESHLGFLIYPGFWLVKRFSRKNFAKIKHKKIVKRRIEKTKENYLLIILMKLEEVIGNWLSFPIGIRCLLTAIRNNKS